jgi:chromosome segregation ATPase
MPLRLTCPIVARLFLPSISRASLRISWVIPSRVILSWVIAVVVQTSSQLETVIKAEIKARIDALQKLHNDNAAEHDILHEQTASAQQKVESVLEAQCALNSKLDTLHAAHIALAGQSRQDAEELRAAAAKEGRLVREVVECKMTAVEDVMKTRTKELETLCQVRRTMVMPA